MKILLFLFLLFVSSAWAAPSRKSCNYYRQIEREYSCGENGYLKKFGIPLCERYLSAEPGLPHHLTKWLQDVRLCLQEELNRGLAEIRTCDTLKKYALDSHTRCYRATGFCDLPLSEKFTVLEITSWYTLEPDVIALMSKMPAVCL